MGQRAVVFISSTVSFINPVQQSLSYILKWHSTISVSISISLWYGNCFFSLCNLSIPGSVRLQGGRSKLDGRVEVYLGGVWGSICSDDWGDEDAAVACRQLGKGWECTHMHTHNTCTSDMWDAAAVGPAPTLGFRRRCEYNLHLLYKFTTTWGFL